MRKLALSFALLAVLACGACKCAVERRAVAEVEASHEKVSKKLLEYVDKDPNIAGPNATEEQKKAARADWKGIVDSDRRNLEALKKAVGD